MPIDIIYFILIIIALWKGFRRGFIIAVFSFLAILLGIAAAMKFSVVVSGWLENNTNIAVHWLPFLSFIIVMIAVIILVTFIARILQKTIELAMLGWLNRLAGIILYIALFTMLYSIILFYATEMGIIKPETVHNSSTYAIIAPWGPKAINMLSYAVPIFRNMFEELQNFFASLADKAAQE